MPDLRYKNCRGCERPSAEVGELSWTRLCGECAKRIAGENLDGLINQTGPHFQHWRRRCLAAFGVGLLDDRGDGA